MSINKWPFYPETILEIMGPDKIELARNIISHFQIGCALNLRKAVIIIGKQSEYLKNKKVDINISQPQWLRFDYAEFCQYFRHGKTENDIICKGGHDRCMAWDEYKGNL